MTLSDGQRRRMLTEALVDLRAAARHIAGTDHGGTGNLARLYNAQPGLRSGGQGNHGPDVGDPTGRAGTADGDQATADLATVDRLLRSIGLDAGQLARALAAYGPPRPAGEADRLALARENRQTGPTCQHCATIKEPFGDGPYRVEADHRRKGPTTVAGRLPEPLVLCAWCADFTAAHDRLPSARQLEQHRDGRRVMVVDDTPRRAS